MVAPLGGAKAALGTNPIAFGFPMEDDPLVIDLGTSAFMGTDPRSPGSKRRRGRKASTRSAFPASARIATARASREGLEIDRRIHDALIALAEGKSRLIACRTP
jgi:LDH2 family malate/lactate/ureidoglycolate dehydrogenase